MKIASPAPGVAKQDLKNNISHPWSMAGEVLGAKCLMKSRLPALPPKPHKLPQSVWDGTKSSISYFNSHLRKQEQAQKQAAGENNCQLPLVEGRGCGEGGRRQPAGNRVRPQPHGVFRGPYRIFHGAHRDFHRPPQPVNLIIALRAAPPSLLPPWHGAAGFWCWLLCGCCAGKVGGTDSRDEHGEPVFLWVY